jgi:hypothetical protein
MAGKSYSSSSPFSSGYSGAKTTSSKKSSPSKTTSTPNPHTSSGSSKTSVASSSQIKASAEKVALATGKSKLDNYQLPKADTPFFLLNLGLNMAQGFRQKSFEINRAYFQKNVAGKLGYQNTFADYQRYITGRSQGTLDAMGRTIAKGDAVGNQMQTQTPPTQPPQTTVPETEEETKKKKRSALGIGYGGSQRTILTSVVGDETEANVSKTILGGGIKA